MEVKKECEQYLAEYYRDLFFGNVNKRYRVMIGVKLRKRLNRLTEANPKLLVRSNELSDVHAMLSKVYAYLMHRKGRLTGLALRQWESSYRQMEELYEVLVRKDLEYVNSLFREDLEQMLKMRDVYRYSFTNSPERAYQLFCIPKTIKRDILGSVK